LPVPPPSNIELISRVPIFALLTPSQAETIAQAVVRRRFRRGALLLRQGERAGALFIIVTGRVRVVTADERGREVILAIRHAGDHIGEMSLIDNEPHSASVRAEVQTDTLELGAEAFTRCLRQSSSMAYALMAELVQRLRQANRKIESLAFMDVYGRVAHVLLEFASPDSEGAMVIRGRVSRQDIAKMVGASREMVSRVMTALEGRGFFEIRADGSTLIKDQSTLNRRPARVRSK